MLFLSASSNEVCAFSDHFFCVFTPQSLRAVGLLFSTMVFPSMGGRREKKVVRAVSQKP